MKGARPFTDEEITNVFNELKNDRDRTLFMVGIRTGLRIGELLSLKIGDVLEHGVVGSQVTVQKKNTKGKRESKTLPLSDSTKTVLQSYLSTLKNPDPQDPLFKSSQSKRAITRIRAHQIFGVAFDALKMEGNLSSHSCRKTFAHKVHKALGGRIEKTMAALCHKSLNSTVQYLEIDREEVKQAILGLG
jgi:integrase/recombinase XerD